MKTSTLVSTVYISLFLILSSSSQQAYATSCTMDYECGVPYGQCSGSVNDCSTTLGGIAVDSSTGYIYYTANCRSDTNDRTSNITIKKVSASGGAPTNVYSEVTLQEGGNIAKVFQVVKDLLYVQRVERMPGSDLVTFNLQSGAQSTVTLNPGFFQAELDIKNAASYSCQLDYGIPNNYTIQRYSGVVGQSSSSTNGLKLYSLGSTECGPVRRGNGNNIIFTGITYTVSNTQQQTVTYTTTFYKGTVVGNHVSLPDVFFTVNDVVNDFVVDASGDIFYGTSSGLFKRSGKTTTTLNNEKVTGIAIYNGKLYFNNGYTIRSVNKDGSDLTQVVQSSTGTCTCRTGFSGSDCQSCSGQVQWEGGFPYCVSVNVAGVPNTCTADYQCGNVPYTVCDITCSCRPNFTGSRCDQCSPPLFLSFVNGIPYCS